MTWFEFYWIVVTIVVFFVLFLPVEIIALRDGKPGGTLSETVWKALYPPRTSRLHRFRRWTRLALFIGLGWVVTHLLTGGWF